jgi:hypothetical protein
MYEEQIVVLPEDVEKNPKAGRQKIDNSIMHQG